MIEELQNSLQAELDKYKTTQKEMQKALTQRQQLDGQLNENMAVKQELDLLKTDNEVFKLVGPVLVKQDLVEAKENVMKRMDYIKAELARMDERVKDLSKKQDNHREAINKLQSLFQQAQSKA
ncbi:hypothetical protein L9F63_005413 [Diploptera punctata]|uniref:Probable prefoldin subunit 6 n=1 Tax=Diploptera punctata TaxID=6984 RepID=A0AAD8E6A4_DIPPU|nr:hypothetical protein L9F63_005413 [Diploptera punctata]